jgi:hypothetical protein
MSLATWLVAGMIPGVNREPLKKIAADPEVLLRLLYRWRDEAIAACASPLTSEHWFLQFRAKACIRFTPIHALSTPVAVCPVIRHPTDLSQKRPTPLVSTTFGFSTTRLPRVHFRSSLGCAPAQGIALNFDSNAHHHDSLPQQLGVI